METRITSSKGLAAALALAVGCWMAPPVHATPLYFEGPSAWGFDGADLAGMPIHLVVDGSYTWDSAGDPSLSPSLSVVTELLGLIGSEPMPPSFATPLLGNVRYTVTNTTGTTLDNEYLVFTLGAVDGAPDPWPFIEPHEFGLDSDGLLLLHAAPYYFGAVLLPVLAPGEMHTFELVHVVADDLAGTVIPTPGLALLVNHTVPEPAAMLLFLLGGLGLAGMGRRR